MTAHAPGLVEQLQADAMDDSVSITVLLRKAKAAAVKLHQAELAEWIDHEMSGYPRDGDIPDYRWLHSSLTFLNPRLGWCPVYGGDTRCHFTGSLAEVSSLLSGDGDFFYSAPPIEVVEEVCRGLGISVNVRRQFSRAAVASIVEAVRNTIHDWALRLEQAGIRGEGLSFSPREAEQARSVVVNIGSIGNATGIGAFGDHATITATQSVDARQLAHDVIELAAEVRKWLESSGLPREVQSAAASHLEELREAASQRIPDEGRIRRGLASLKGTLENAAGSLIASGVVAMIVKLLGGG